MTHFLKITHLLHSNANTQPCSRMAGPRLRRTLVRMRRTTVGHAANSISRIQPNSRQTNWPITSCTVVLYKLTVAQLLHAFYGPWTFINASTPVFKNVCTACNTITNSIYDCSSRLLSVIVTSSSWQPFSKVHVGDNTAWWRFFFSRQPDRLRGRPTGSGGWRCKSYGMLHRTDW